MWNFEVGEGRITIPNLIVYYRASPQTCFRRTPGHGRKEEGDIAPQYFSDLHALHERWLCGNNRGTAPLVLPEQEETELEEIPEVPVLVLDGERRWTAEELDSVIKNKLASIES